MPASRYIIVADRWTIKADGSLRHERKIGDGAWKLIDDPCQELVVLLTDMQGVTYIERQTEEWAQ